MAASSSICDRSLSGAFALAGGGLRRAVMARRITQLPQLHLLHVDIDCGEQREVEPMTPVEKAALPDVHLQEAQQGRNGLERNPLVPVLELLLQGVARSLVATISREPAAGRF